MRPRYESAPPNVCHKDLCAILDNFESHLIPDEYHIVPTPIHCTIVDTYMTWLYTVSHPIMTHTPPRRPHRPVNHKVLEAQDDQAESVTTVCRLVVEMDKTDIDHDSLRMSILSWPSWRIWLPSYKMLCSTIRGGKDRGFDIHNSLFLNVFLFLFSDKYYVWC